MSAGAITSEQRALRQRGRLDQRCRSCGATSAASSRCYHCQSRDLEYREHVPGPKPGEPGEKVAQWCHQVSGGARHVPDPAKDPRRFWKESSSRGLNAEETPAPLSAAGSTLWGES